MARPRKNNAEYFSHDADLRNNIKIRTLRNVYGHVGYATYCMLLEILTDSDGFRIQNNELQMKLIAGDIGIKTEEFIEILHFMQELELLGMDAESIWNDHLLERMQPLLHKRQVMQENYKVRGGIQKDPPPTPQPAEPRPRKQYLSEDQWREFINLYKTEGKNNDDSIYKAKKIFLKIPAEYTHSTTGEIKKTWDDISSSLALWKNSNKWRRGYKHMATTWLNGHLWEVTPEPYIDNKPQNNGQAPKRTSGYSDTKV